MKQNANDARRSQRLLLILIEGKHTYSRRTDSCCADEAIHRRGICRHKDGGAGKGNKSRDKAKSKKEERRGRKEKVVLQAVIYIRKDRKVMTTRSSATTVLVGGACGSANIVHLPRFTMLHFGRIPYPLSTRAMNTTCSQGLKLYIDVIAISSRHVFHLHYDQVPKIIIALTAATHQRRKVEIYVYTMQ